MGMIGLIIINIIVTILFVIMVRYCNDNNTSWESKGVEILVLFIALCPVVNLITLIVMTIDVFLVKESTVSNSLGKFFKSK